MHVEAFSSDEKKAAFLIILSILIYFFCGMLPPISMVFAFVLLSFLIMWLWWFRHFT